MDNINILCLGLRRDYKDHLTNPAVEVVKLKM